MGEHSKQVSSVDALTPLGGTWCLLACWFEAVQLRNNKAEITSPIVCLRTTFSPSKT